MIEKEYIQGNDLFLDAYRLARKVLESGFRPTFITALWRGGAAVGVAVQEYLAVHGVRTDHTPVVTEHCDNDVLGRFRECVQVHAIEYIVEHANAQDRLLIIDDVYETGDSIREMIGELTRKMRKNLPEDIRSATIHYKPGSAKGTKPDFHLYESDVWLVYPHELKGLTGREIREGKGQAVYDLLLPHLFTGREE